MAATAAASLPASWLGRRDVVRAEYTLPFNESDITYFFPLYIQTVAHLGFFPLNITADAADLCLVHLSDLCASWRHRRHCSQPARPPREPSGPRWGATVCRNACVWSPLSNSVIPAATPASAFSVPSCIPIPQGSTVTMSSSPKRKAVSRITGFELGGQMRVSLQRTGPHCHPSSIASAPRLSASTAKPKPNSTPRPHVRNRRSVANLNTLTYIVINAKALKRVRKTNRDLLTPKGSLAA